MESELVQRILDWAQQKALADERKQLRELNKNLAKGKVLKLIDAKARFDRERCTLALFEGDCLHEDTEILVFRDSVGCIDLKIKDINLGDFVVTHKNALKEVVAKSSKISKTIKIVTNKGKIDCSPEHRLWVYDTQIREFLFIEAKNIQRERHKLVKNKLNSFGMFLKILNVSVEDKVIVSCENETIIASKDHKFASFDTDDGTFKMVKSTDLLPSRHFLVLNNIPSK
jgi:hypothetical protein